MVYEPKNELESKIIKNLRMVYDPEIPVNIVDLGLIYNLEVDKDNIVAITMTLTNPNCPVIEELVYEVLEAARLAEGVADAKLDLTFDPPWEKSMMSDVARVSLDMW